MSRKGVLVSIKEHCEPIVEELGYDLVDLEYVKENNKSFLRFYIGKSGGINIDDCQIVSENVGSKLDEIDLIKDSYYLEISSPGLNRPLKTDKDLKRNLGKKIDVSLYTNLDGKKKYTGELVGFSEEDIIIKEKGSEGIEIKRDIIADIKLAIEF